MDNLYILGPCSMENRELYLSTAKYLYELMGNRNWIYKASFDKANRTSIHGGRGLGHNLIWALDLMKEVKELCPNIKITTDIHEPWQASYFKNVVDVIQVPAFLCRQTDLIVACAQNYDIVNVKKMQHLGPNNINKSIDKIREVNPKTQAWLTDRGTCLGYDHLIVDFAMVPEYDLYDKVILDSTHSTQRSKKIYGVQGDRQLAERYFVSSKIFGYNGVFAETHPKPQNATSDGDCQIVLDRIPALISKFEAIAEVIEE